MISKCFEAFVEKVQPNWDVIFGGISLHGKDKPVWADGCSGQGQFSWPSGATFQGGFRDGRMEGPGIFVGPDGATYQGFWAADQRHGDGVQRYANGDYYAGQWRRNMQDGQGLYVCANGNSYAGMWEKGAPSGTGVFTFPNGPWQDSCVDLPLPAMSPAVGAVRKRSSMEVIEENVAQISILQLESEGEAGDFTYAPAGGGSLSDAVEEDNGEETNEGFTWAEGELKGLSLADIFEGLAGKSSLSTINEDDASSTNSEIIPPNGKIMWNIKSWKRGEFLGCGSFGNVYKGMSDDGAFFAVKEVCLLDQGNKAQPSIVALEQEMYLLSQFEHENIVQYYGTDKEESKLYIFIELVTQGSLSSLYQKYGGLQNSQVSAYTRQILNGLVYLHERNVVHRDIKCANILVHANGLVKLADFGLAKKMDGINNLKSCLGSIYWMAPEVINPRKTYGLKADIWSLGCTVFEMLTGDIPYPGVDPIPAAFKIVNGAQPTIPSCLSNEAQDFIGRCVRIDPASRPTASELLAHPFVKMPL